MIDFKKISGFIWIIPFIAFAFGYIGLRVCLHKKRINTPDIIGKTVQEGLSAASDLFLNLRILKEVESSDFKPGTILEQQPLSNFPIQLNQTIFVVVTKSKGSFVAPNFLEMNFADIQNKSADLGLNPKIMFFQSYYPKDSCFVQFPMPGQSIDGKDIVLYISSGNTQFVVVPNFKGKKVFEVEEISEKNNIMLSLILKKEDITEDKKNLVVLEQKPLPGSIIDFSKKLYLQLLVDVG